MTSWASRVYRECVVGEFSLFLVFDMTPDGHVVAFVRDGHIRQG